MVKDKLRLAPLIFLASLVSVDGGQQHEQTVFAATPRGQEQERVMNWLLFYLLAGLHAVAFIVIGVKSTAWMMRLVLWGLLVLSPVWYCWDYFAIKHQHEQMCAAEGGLRVLIQPEKADRVRLVGDSFIALDAQAVLEKYYPRVQLVESKSGEWDSSTNKKQEGYLAYTVAANPRAGQQSLTHAADKEGPYIFPESKVEALDTNIYEISVHESTIPNGTSKETRLSKGGKVYAKYTKLVHWWTGIQYPDALPTWRCPAQILSPPKDEPSAPREKWNYPRSPQYPLVELLLR